MSAADPLRRLRRQRQVEVICRTPRLVFELIDELARHHPALDEDIGRRLEAYAELSPATLRAVGADRFAPRPLRVVDGGGGR